MDDHAPILAPVPRAVVSHQASHVYHAELTSAGYGCTWDGSGTDAGRGRSLVGGLRMLVVVVLGTS
jgi:hypothetical protein